MNLTTQQRDVLLAGAIGDAVGYVVEFSKLQKILKDYGSRGFTLDLIQPTATLNVSDDTQMTLFTLEALHKGKGANTSMDAFYASFKQWFYTQTEWYNDAVTSPPAKFPSMQHQRAPGMTCLAALNKTEPRPKPINDSKGCGGIMRAAPCGFIDNLQDAMFTGSRQAEATHGNPSGYISAGVFAGLIHMAMYYADIGLEDAVKSCISMLDEVGMSETIDIVDKAMRIAQHSEGDFYSDIRRIGEGWVGEEALAIAIYSVYVATTFEEVIQISINHDGDSDSTGSLAAQLWAALYGLPEKYREWEKRLDIADAFAYATDGENYK